MVMLVKKATFRRMGSGGKGRTGNRCDVSGPGQSAPPEVYISRVSTSTVGATTDLFLVTLQCAVL